MSGQQEAARVLARLGSRLLTHEELAQVSGGIHTANCSFDPVHCRFDGDCEPPPRCPL